MLAQQMGQRVLFKTYYLQLTHLQMAVVLYFNELLDLLEDNLQFFAR